MKKRKKKNRRNKVKYPALDPLYNPKIRQEYVDYDYADQLSDEEKEFLNQFSEEYYGASLDFSDLSNNLHNTTDLKKDCTDRNNWRNNDLYGVSKATSRLMFNYDADFEHMDDDGGFEDYLVDQIYIKELRETNEYLYSKNYFEL